MNDSMLLETLGQVSTDFAGEVFRQHLRGAVMQMISEVMAREVSELCGPKHYPVGGDCYRNGTASGRVIVDGQREEVVRPRVRQRSKDGKTAEVPLETYQAANCPAQLHESIITALVAGVSTRDVKQVQPKSPGVSKSNVSRHWQSVGHQFVDELRDKDLSTTDWAILMLDGIRLSKDQLAIVAIGITADGYKHVLDFELGSSENAEVCRGLMRRLMKRGFHADRRLLAEHPICPYCSRRVSGDSVTLWDARTYCRKCVEEVSPALYDFASAGGELSDVLIKGDISAFRFIAFIGKWYLLSVLLIFGVPFLLLYLAGNGDLWGVVFVLAFFGGGGMIFLSIVTLLAIIWVGQIFLASCLSRTVI